MAGDSHAIATLMTQNTSSRKLEGQPKVLVTWIGSENFIHEYSYKKFTGCNRPANYYQVAGTKSATLEDLSSDSQD